jgi:hypothetical protein
MRAQPKRAPYRSGLAGTVRDRPDTRSFQGGIRTVVPRVAVHERAGVLSLLFTVSYLGLGVPAVSVGFLASTATA